MTIQTKKLACVLQCCTQCKREVLFVCFREAPVEESAEPEDAGGRVAPVAAGLAAVERLQRAAQQEDAHASQGQASPPKKPFRTPSVPSLCALATRATVHLMTGENIQFQEGFQRMFLTASFVHSGLS